MLPCTSCSAIGIPGNKCTNKCSKCGKICSGTYIRKLSQTFGKVLFFCGCDFETKIIDPIQTIREDK